MGGPGKARNSERRNALRQALVGLTDANIPRTAQPPAPLPSLLTLQSMRYLSACVALATLSTTLAAQALPKPALPQKPALRTAKADRKLERRWARPVHAKTVVGVPTPGPLTAAEVEHNGTVGWADSFGSQPDYDGDIAFSGDLDNVKLQLNADSQVVFDVSQTGGLPIADATLLIRDAAGQFVAYNDDRPASLMPLIAIPLPAGTYYCEIAGYGANTGTYKLTTTVVPTAFAIANPGVPVNGVVPAGGEVGFLLPIVADARVTVSVSANGGQDLYLACLRGTGAVHRFVDDTGASLDPGIETHLIAGLYMLVFGDVNGVGGAFTFDVTATFGLAPSVVCGGAANGNTIDDRSLELFALNVATPSTIDLLTGPSGGTPMTDSILTVYDRSLNTILWNDDTSGLFSRMNIPLPAGQYFVGVEAYSAASAGSFALNATCTPGATPTPARFGVTAGGNLANAGDVTALTFTAGTSIPVEVLVDTALTTLPDPMLAILDASGACLAFDDDGGPGTDSLGGTRIGVGAHWALIRDFGSGTGTFDLAVTGPIAFPTTTKGNLELKDKAGNVHFLYATPSLLGFGFPVPAPFTGNLLVNLGAFVALPPLPIPISGNVTYPATFPNLPYFVQGLSVTLAPLGGEMTNVTN